MDLESTSMLSEIRQKAKYCVISLLCRIIIQKAHEQTKQTKQMHRYNRMMVIRKGREMEYKEGKRYQVYDHRRRLA